ncbi:tail completion protein gp17 [Streptomyces sp. UG1]|uniref:tail completion protein gp17 n=1 Tax=Streptomyces sp. UG1 TaxID=3417652 RepID=UPI003CE72FF5
MADFQPFPNIEALLVAALAEFGTCGQTFPPAKELAASLPFIRVRRLGGGDDRRTDRPRVDVEVAAKTYSQAMDIALKVQQRLISGWLFVPGVGLMDRALTELGPNEVTDADPHTRHIVATYECHTRRSA